MSAAATQSYTDFSARWHARMVRERVAAEASIELTRRCPLQCAHCYNNLPMHDAGARRGELTREEHYRLLDQMAEAGCLWLLYTGGEIFARADFLDIYTYAKRKGFLITLFTNGTLITPRIADHLVEWRPFAIEITLYGATRETYERLTGVPGSFEHCLRGIELLRERGLPLKLKAVAVSINKHEIADMKRFADARGLDFRFDAMMNARVDCSPGPLAVRLEPWETVKLDLEDPERVAEWKRFAERFSRPAPADRCDEMYQCGGGISGFSIDPCGMMSICVLSGADKYDLRRGSFAEGWGQFLRSVRRKKITRVTKCTACQIKSMCGMCPANGELENQDPEAPVDFLCYVAHLRAEALDIRVPPHGDCEYCAGGPAHDRLLASADALRSHRSETSADAGSEKTMLRVLNDSCGSGGGCSACGQ